VETREALVRIAAERLQYWRRELVAAKEAGETERAELAKGIIREYTILIADMQQVIQRSRSG
jgi:hypothetical protein